MGSSDLRYICVKARRWIASFMHGFRAGWSMYILISRGPTLRGYFLIGLDDYLGMSLGTRGEMVGGFVLHVGRVG